MGKDDTAERPLVLDSDSDSEDARAEEESEDDVPLIRRSAKASGKPPQRVSSQFDAAPKLSPLTPSTVSPEPHALQAFPLRPRPASATGSKNVGNPVPDLPAATPLPLSPFWQSPVSHYGERTNLSSVFKSSRKTPNQIPTSPQSAAQTSSPASSAHNGIVSTPTSAASCRTDVPRRVPTPERLFTNMTLLNVNKLIESMSRVQTEERGAAQRRRRQRRCRSREARQQVVERRGLGV